VIKVTTLKWGYCTPVTGR